MGFDEMFSKRLDCVLSASVPRNISYTNTSLRKQVCRIDCEILSPAEQDNLVGLCYELYKRDKSVAKMKITNNCVMMYSI